MLKLTPTMAQDQARKIKLNARKKKKFELGSDPVKPKLTGTEKRKKIQMKGGGDKTVAVTVKYANISTGGKAKKVEIKMVLDNPANRDFRRENILSRGGIIDTELGKAKITSRPSQDGVVNAVLVK